MSTNGLSPAGSSSYTSNTLHVGDGTWDHDRDDFLLPNLVGLNFDTMRYNGMGNRFRGLPEYHKLILGHGVLAAITFLFIVPAAIFFAKYGAAYVSNRTSMKMHVYLQILTVFLSTVVLILGWFAVGPERSLTNPHHGIGVAIYVCIMVQFLYGWLMSRLERRRKNPMALIRVPAKVWMHKLFGRAIALLAIVNIALGLTLYGSPKTLFILLGIWGFVLLFGYLALDRHQFEKRPVDFGIVGGGGGGRPGRSEMYSDHGSYFSGSRTDLTQDHRRPAGRDHKTHWGRDLLAAGGILGAYEAYKHRKSKKREEREQAEIDAERRNDRPPPMMSGGRPPGRPPAGMGLPPAAGPGFNQGYRPDFDQGFAPSMAPPMAVATPNRPRSRLDSRPPTQGQISPQSWEDEKYTPTRQQHTWRDRILGAGVGFGAFEGARRLFTRRKREDDYAEHGDYRPPLDGNQSEFTQTDVSRVQAGHAPFSPGDALRHDRPNMDDSQMTPVTPTRPSRRPRQSRESDVSYDDDESTGTPTPMHHPGDHTLRESVATFGAFAGFREWNKSRRERREQQRADKTRQQELEAENRYTRRTSTSYPRPQDAGRGESLSDTLLTGATGPADPGFAGSNPELARNNFNRLPPGPDTLHPPLPVATGTIPSSAPGPPSTVGPSVSRQNVNMNMEQGYSIPPPPPGLPPNSQRPEHYQAPEPGSLQMPLGAMNPDPSRLVSQDNVSTQQQQQLQSGVYTGPAAASITAAERRRRERRGSASQATTSAEASQVNTALNANPNPALISPSSPPVSVKVKMHNDGRHVTLRRLNEEEAEAERNARRQDRRQRRRRDSSLSSGIEEAAVIPSGQRYRRPSTSGRVRPSSSQPITNVPPPPAMSSSAVASSHRPLSELNLPPLPPQYSQQSPPAGGSGVTGAGISIGSGLSLGGQVQGVGSPGDHPSDVSNFDNSRRRRRAERARKLVEARGTGGRGVEFE